MIVGMNDYQPQWQPLMKALATVFILAAPCEPVCAGAPVAAALPVLRLCGAGIGVDRLIVWRHYLDRTFAGANAEGW